ncbi:unnamed protein product [Candidula unifasciata]|uniref:F-box domain-containing protein n=1 Tax=Candidula unifasciata TaxID=100452 RepID=A0A8S3ZPN7_9EUPU|nr:unnamed protein product [Candidula unifasciata]
MGRWNFLPDEILLMIFKYLEVNTYNVAKCVDTLLSGLSCLQYGRSTIQSFEMCQLFFEETWSFFRSSKCLLVDCIAEFLETQTNVKMLSIHHAFLTPPFAYRIMKSFERSKSVKTLEVLDLLNYYSIEVTTGVIGKQLRSVCGKCWKLQEIRLNYSYLSSANVVDLCEYLEDSLKNLFIFMTSFDYTRGWSIISSDSWKLARQACPRLQVYFNFEGWPIDAVSFLVPCMPLVELTSRGTQCRYSTLTFGDKTTLLLNHLAEGFADTVRSATFIADAQTCTPPSRDSVIKFLIKCQQVKSLVFSKQLMTPELINQVRTENPHNIIKDFTTVKIV